MNCTLGGIVGASVIDTCELPALAGHGPSSPQGVFDEIESGAGVQAPTFAESREFRPPTILRSIEEEILGRNLVGQLIVPLDDQPRHGLARVVRALEGCGIRG